MVHGTGESCWSRVWIGACGHPVMAARCTWYRGRTAQNGDQQVAVTRPLGQPLGLGPHTFRGPLPVVALPFCLVPVAPSSLFVSAGRVHVFGRVSGCPNLTFPSRPFPADWALLAAPPSAPRGDLVSILELLLAAALFSLDSPAQSISCVSRAGRGAGGSGLPGRRLPPGLLCLLSPWAGLVSTPGREAEGKPKRRQRFYLNNFLRILITKGIHFHLERLIK